MKVDYSTWCDSSIKAGVQLATILDEHGDSKLVSKVNTHVHRFSIRLNSINHLEKSERRYFMDLLHNDAKVSVMNTTFPSEVKTFLLNLLATKYKRKLELI